MDLEPFDIIGACREVLRARIVSFIQKYKCRHDEIKVTVPRVWIEGVEVTFADVPGVTIEFRKQRPKASDRV